VCIVVSVTANCISKSFTTGKIRIEVIRELSLQIHAGELTLMMGPSGSGKSTLLAMLSGLMRPDEGAVLISDYDLWSHDADDIDRFRLENCGFIFQGFNLFPALTALEQVLLPMKYAGMRGAQARCSALDALTLVGLKERTHLRPLELSGGEKQRVAIARAIVKSPKLLFADEPTSALDSANGQIVVDILHRIAREHGSTVLCVTHDPRLVKHADRILQLEDGRIIADSRNEGSSHMEMH
jgi:putative ABC transport system ATP-binding protein